MTADVVDGRGGDVAAGSSRAAAFRGFDASSRILIVGAGKMGEAIAAGWISSDRHPADAISPSSIDVANPGEARRAHMAEHYGVTVYESASAAAVSLAALGCDVRYGIVVLAVKPQVMFDAIARFADHPAFAGGKTGPLFVSIAAGLSAAKIEAALPAGSRVVRVMPNTPLMVSAGASGVCGGANATSDDVDLVRGLFACLGEAVVVEEADMDAVCAVSGSGPAYVAAMIEAVRDAAVLEGLDAQLAERLATQTVFGTAKLMLDRGQSAEDTRIAVCSPGGTTLAALDAMNASGFNEVFQAGVSACVKRSKELGSC